MSETDIVCFGLIPSAKVKTTSGVSVSYVIFCLIKLWQGFTCVVYCKVATNATSFWTKGPRMGPRMEYVYSKGACYLLSGSKL